MAFVGILILGVVIGAIGGGLLELEILWVVAGMVIAMGGLLTMTDVAGVGSGFVHLLRSVALEGSRIKNSIFVRVWAGLVTIAVGAGWAYYGATAG